MSRSARPSTPRARDALCGVAFASFYGKGDAPLEQDAGAPASGLWIGKLADSGAILWQRTIAVPQPQSVSVAAARTGEVYLATFAGAPIDFGAGLLDCGHCLAKYDAAGTLLWARAIDGAGAGVKDPRLAIGVDGDGNVVVAGTMRGTLDFGLGPMTANARRDVFAIAFDPSGAPRWQRRIGGPEDQIATSIAVSATGSVAVAGHATDGLSGLTGALYAAFTPNGQLRFTHQDTPTAKAETRATRIAIGAADQVAVVVEPATPTGAGTLVAVHADGAKSWEKGLALRATGVGFDDAGHALVIGEPGACPIDLGGGALPTAGGADGAFGLFDATGKHLVSRRFRGVPDAVAVDPSGAIAIVGTGRGGSVDLGGGLTVIASDSATTFAARTRP